MTSSLFCPSTPFGPPKKNSLPTERGGGLKAFSVEGIRAALLAVNLLWYPAKHHKTPNREGHIFSEKVIFWEAPRFMNKGIHSSVTVVVTKRVWAMLILGTIILSRGWSCFAPSDVIIVQLRLTATTNWYAPGLTDSTTRPYRLNQGNNWLIPDVFHI